MHFFMVLVTGEVGMGVCGNLNWTLEKIGGAKGLSNA